MTDYTWKGPPADIDALIYDAGTTNTKTGLDIIGPRTLDGVSYVNIKTEQSLNIPSTCSETGPELSAALLGVWYSAAAEEVLKQSEVDNTKN